MSLVTVSLPMYRAAETIADAVESILGQTFRDFRLVVVNDGEDPATAWRPLAHVGDPRLIRFDLGENGGRYRADAVTLAACETEWWTCHDADDWSEPDRLEKLLAASGDADLVLGGYRLHRPNGEHRDRSPEPRLVRRPKPLRHVAHHTGLFRTDALRSIGGPNPDFRVAWDTFLVGVAVNTLRVAVVPEPLYHYRQRKESLAASIETGMGSAYRLGVHKVLRQAWQDFLQDGRILEPKPETRELVEADAARLRAIVTEGRAVA